jgi:hypothetical protein
MGHVGLMNQTHINSKPQLLWIILLNDASSDFCIGKRSNQKSHYDGRFQLFLNPKNYFDGFSQNKADVIKKNCTRYQPGNSSNILQNNDNTTFLC